MKRQSLEIGAMCRGWKAGVLAIVAAFACASAAGAQAHSPSNRTVYHRHVSGTLHRSFIRHIGYGRVYGLRAHHVLRGRRGHFVALVGDPDNGLGFYPFADPVSHWRLTLSPA
jgi:hypothetical protein